MAKMATTVVAGRAPQAAPTAAPQAAPVAQPKPAAAPQAVPTPQPKPQAPVIQQQAPAPQTAVAVVQQQEAAPLLPTLDSRPQWMIEYEGPTGLELLGQYVIPPRVKIVQKTSSVLRQRYKDGTLLVMPDEKVLAHMADPEAGQAFAQESYAVPFIPIFFYPEWLVLNPYAAKDLLNFVRDRSTDPKSDIARKARAGIAEICPEMPKNQKGEDLYVVYQQTLNYMILPQIDDSPAEPVLLGFRSGDYFSGTRFNGLLQKRGARTPIFGNVFQMYSKWRPGSGSGDYFGINVQNPDGCAPWVESADLTRMLKDMHESYAQTHADGLLQASYDGAEHTGGATVADSEIPF